LAPRLAAWIGLLFLSLGARAELVTISWEHPTLFTDGTPLSLEQIQSTRVEWGTCLGEAFGVAITESMAMSPASSVTISSLAGQFCFRAFTQATPEAGGTESAASLVGKHEIFGGPVPILRTWSKSIYDRTSSGAIGRIVGTAPVGTPCIGPLIRIWLTGVTFYEVPRSMITLKLGAKPRSSMLVGKCRMSL
jgi:hypothetical protein